jgi:hypothetical protein
MKVSSFFNTHTHKRCPFEWTKLGKAFLFQLSKLLFKLNQLAQGIQHRFLEKGGL